MEPKARENDADLVRCLDCGTIYSQPANERDVGECPNCGYVGWIALSIEQRLSETGK